ncbi:MAG: hypothetical protein FWE50_04615, partial [Alphaproteobacteria bacterium]|nr:hypothetical protein [Alphaproteobacteria bacterium]
KKEKSTEKKGTTKTGETKKETEGEKKTEEMEKGKEVSTIFLLHSGLIDTKIQNGYYNEGMTFATSTGTPDGTILSSELRKCTNQLVEWLNKQNPSAKYNWCYKSEIIRGTHLLCQGDSNTLASLDNDTFTKMYKENHKTNNCKKPIDNFSIFRVGAVGVPCTNKGRPSRCFRIDAGHWMTK